MRLRIAILPVEVRAPVRQARLARATGDGRRLARCLRNPDGPPPSALPDMSNTPRIKILETAAERREFLLAVLDDLETFGAMLGDGAFETGVRRLGAEQELDFIDADYRPAPLVPEILGKLGPGPFNTEYARFNLEINSRPHRITGDAFRRLERELAGHLAHVSAVAREHFDARTILTGLLPTIRRQDVRPGALTPNPRYKTMLALVNRMRGTDYEFHIRGIDELVTRDNPTAFGGSFTSFQVHCQTEPELLPAHYNWAQMIAGPVLAAATNSPLFLGRRLWRETRVALFAQTTDTRRPQDNLLRQEPRVTFGRDWVRGDILSLFRGDLSRYRAFVTHLGGNKTQPEDADVPALAALTFHNGTIYRWNRVCYGTGGGKPHLRIENRILPAGPTLVDEMANAAFWLGLMLALPEDAARLPAQVPFRDAHSNFLKAARSGLGVAFRWFGETVPAKELILETLLPLARRGLDAHGVDADDSGRLLGIIADRVDGGCTGAQWILDAFDTLRQSQPRGEAAMTLTAEMHARAGTGPVHQWEPVSPETAASRVHCDASWTLEQSMVTDVITVHPDDPPEFAAKLMSWNDLSHLPAIEDDGRLAGILSRSRLFEHMVAGGADTVRELLPGPPLTLPLDASLPVALAALRDSSEDCIAVMEGGSLAGIVTGADVVRLAPQMLAGTAGTQAPFPGP